MAGKSKVRGGTGPGSRAKSVARKVRKQRAVQAFGAARMHASAFAEYADKVWTRPYHAWLDLCEEVLQDDKYPLTKLPADVMALGVSWWNDLVAAQHDCLAACKEAYQSSYGALLVLDEKSEAAGPVSVAPAGPVESVDEIRVVDLIHTDGVAEIDSDHIVLRLEEGLLQVNLIDLTPIQPLQLGLYSAELVTNEDVFLATIRALVVETINE